MKTPELAKVRVQILLTFVVVELIGFFYFCAHRLQQPHGDGYFKIFILLSAIGIPLVTAALWLDWIQRRRVSYYRVFLVVACGLFSFASWSKGEKLYASLFAAMSLIFCAAVLLSLVRNVDENQQEINVKALEAERNRLRPVIKYAIMLIVWLALMAWSWYRAERPIPFWAVIPLALPALWLAWRLGFHIVNGQRATRDAKTSTKTSN